MSEPLLTIITVCLNRAGTIAAAIDSVVRQNASDVEHLVVDGVSTDGTLAVVARYPHIRVVSEPDKGLYDAMNKGLRLARGRYVFFLNSDDELADGVIDSVRSHMQAGSDVVCIGTDVQRPTSDGTRETIETITDRDAILLSPTSAALGSPLLNAKFMRLAFLRERVGEFDIRYRLAADVDLLLRAAIAGPEVVVVPIVGHHYMQHVGSLTIDPEDKNGRRAAEECLAIATATLERPDLPAHVRFLMRAWKGGKLVAIALIDRRRSRKSTAVRDALAAWPDVLRYGWYLMNRKRRTAEQRYAVEIARQARAIKLAGARA